MYSPPVDLSFKNIINVSESLSVVPRAGLRPLKTNSEGKHLSRSLRLNNNYITELDGLQFMLSHFLAQPSNLGWLDLSFNKIKLVEPVLCELRGLRVLYFHANSIWNLSEVDKLGELPHLHTITLHGNGIEQHKGYRKHVIFALPHLKTMDFSGVTREERALANVWHQCMKRRKDTKENLQ
ncbi:leucine-rich repeat-containing protein 51-like [Anabas testudineus]|uniref:leucine-rich repeat-containing protein 51-like n=1 Tax=Anabas testudineus TaxID=64144 RepID=UPI000E45C147|nr:leucine-rich repeat-containing protein 51-like [Anabas testudineus]